MTENRTPLTVAELERWEEHGATWRVRQRTPGGLILELCSCSGEPVDLREGTGAELLAYVGERDRSD